MGPTALAADGEFGRFWNRTARPEEVTDEHRRDSRTNAGTMADRHLGVPAPSDQRGDEMVRIRTVSPVDLPDLIALHDEVSRASYWARFSTVARWVGRDHVRALFDGSSPIRRTGVVAFSDDRLVALGSACRTGWSTAEVAVLVVDAAQREGVGTQVLCALLVRLRHGGIHTFVADIRIDNPRAVETVRRAGFVSADVPHFGMARFELRDGCRTHRPVQSALSPTRLERGRQGRRQEPRLNPRGRSHGMPRHR